MGAFEILHMIQENFTPLPCILISEYISKEDQINALLSRVNTIFPKPVNFGLVRETVGHLIERYYIEGI
jgi:CheY-like chemotaxis protein